MEAVGFVAAIISVGKTVKTVSRVYELLYRVAKESPGISVHINRSRIPLCTVDGTVRAAVSSLQRHCTDDPDLPTIHYIRKSGLPASLKEWLFQLRSDIRDLETEIEKLGSSIRWKVWMSFQWALMKPKIEALFALMESLKTTLGLILGVIHLEMTMASRGAGAPTEKLEKEIAELKSVIAEHLETIRQLREEHNLRSFAPSGRTTVDSLIILCYLAKSMVSSEEIPTSSPATFTFSKPRRRRSRISAERPKMHPYRPRRQHADPHPRHSLFLLNNDSIRVAPSSSPHGSVTRIDDANVAANTQLKEEEEYPIEDGARVQPASQTPPQNIPEITIQSPTEISDDTANPTEDQEPEPPDTNDAIPAEESPPPQEEPAQVEPRNDRDSPSDDTDLHDAVVAGYVPVGSRHHIVKAHVDRTLKLNLISRACADRLQLKVEQHTGMAGGGYRDRSIQSVGKTVLRWGDVEISCYVCDNLDRPLTFGRAFSRADLGPRAWRVHDDVG